MPSSLLSAGTPSSDHSQVVATPRYRWVVLFLTVVCFIATFLVRFAWSPLIPLAAPDLGMNMSEAGAYMSAFFLGYVITQVPAGVLSDRFGVRLLLAGSLVVEGLATIALSWATSYEVGLALRVVTGLAAGVDYAACSRAIVEWFPQREHGRAFGLMLASPPTGLLLANWIAPILSASLGWRGAFLVIGVATLIIGVFLYLLLRSTGGADRPQSMLAGLRTTVTNRQVMLIAVVGFCLLWLQTGVATWANTFMKGYGLSLSATGQVMVLFSVGGILASIASGFLSDRLGRRSIIVLVSYAVLVPITVLFGFQSDFTSFALVGFVMGFVAYLGNPQFSALVAAAAGKELAATANGVSNLVFQTASILGPWIIGFSIDATGGFQLLWWLLAIGPLAGFFVMLLVAREERATSASTQRP